MRTRIENCPGGLAVIVPQHLADQVGLHAGGPAEMELSGGRLVIRPVGPATLAELLAGTTHDNIHEEWADDPPVGAELL